MNKILEAIYELVAPGDITTDRVVSVIESHPELLTSEAETLARAVAESQTSSEARQTMEQVAELLNRCRLLGVWPGINERSRNIAKQQSQQRFQQVRQRMMQRRLESTGSIEQFGAAPIDSESFESLNDCLKFISANYAPEPVQLEARDFNARIVDKRVSVAAPKYLFRGESGQYPKTTTSLYRVNADVTLPLKALEHVVMTRVRLHRDLSEKYGLASVIAEGLLQHYGLPTDFLDLTASLDVAVCFATDLHVGQIGGICVAPTQRLQELGTLVNLRGVASAARPRRQEAFAMSCDTHYNYKNDKTVRELGLKWHWFRFTEADAHAFPPRPELLDAHTDRASGLMELLISGYGRIHDQAAKWLAKRLQPAPFVCVSLPRVNENEDLRVAWISAEEAGIPYVETDSSEHNYKRWSDKYIDPPKRWLPDELLLKSTESLQPGSILRITSARGLEHLPPEFLKESVVDPLIQ